MRIKYIGTRPAPAAIRALFAAVARGRGPTIVVQRREIPYWQERGWTRRGNTYIGVYQTPFAAFRGQIIEHPGGHIEFLLRNPSEQIRRHGHWVCFQEREGDWYMIHMGKQPGDVSSGIIAIERLITEAYQE